MTEYEIVAIISEHANRQWNIMQFWASISFGLILVAYIATERLKLPMVIVLSVLYIIFSMFVLNMLKLNGGVVDGYVIDLQNISNATSLLKQGSKNLIDLNIHNQNLLLIIITYMGTFIGSLIFLWYSFFMLKNKKTATKNEKEVDNNA